MKPRASVLLPALLCLAGCGASGTLRGSRQVAAAVVQAERSHEYSSPQPRQDAVGGSPSATAAVVTFATAYINWSAGSVSQDMRTLSARCIGQARAAMQLAAAQAASDYELQRGGIANSGTVEAVAPLPRGRNQYVVVTRELTTATATNAYQGLQPAWHVAVATVSQQRPGQWVLSGWQPES